MISLSSDAAAIEAIRRARDVSFAAYLLPPGPVFDALAGAARRGAHVRVRLEGAVYKDGGALADVNARAVARLAAAGADAQIVHPADDSADPVLHLKAAVADGTLFLNDRNWPGDGGDTIVRDSSTRDARFVESALAGAPSAAAPSFATRKRDALALEARLIDGARRGQNIALETEAFGRGNRVYAALERAATRGAHVRVLVASRDISKNERERDAIAALERDGVAVRACGAAEKYTVLSSGRAWIGSADATAAFNVPDQLDWGLRSNQRPLVRHLQRVFAARWRSATAVNFKT